MPAAALLASPLIFELNIVTSYSYLLNDNAVIFADNVILFNMDDYLSYVRNSSTFESKFISTMREYSKTQPDGIEISIFNQDD